ncbi:MAG: translation initiation factor eIF-1A [Nanoarchaeota archaeon]|nr:translation initiation factor eIF-1A [Nanoarchaeota archaeon]
MSIKKELQRKHEQYQMEIQRVRLPKGREVFGVLVQRLGASRSKVKCLDGKERNCRIPGRLKRKLWVREGDIVLVEPWEYNNEKGDIVHKYRISQVQWLNRKGYLKGLEESEEF